MTTVAGDETWKRLGAVSQLLHHTAAAVWSDADQAAPDSPLHDLALGVYLAGSRASALLPEDFQLSDVDLEERTPLQLLTEAELLTRPLPLHRPALVDASQLVLDVCDLIREARGLGY